MATATNPKAIVERGYDQVADKYLAWSSPRPTDTRTSYIQKLLAALPSNAKVLELGCGAGVPSTQMLIAHSNNISVTGVDISAAQIALAKIHVPDATLIHSDMMSLEFDVGHFDAIVAFYSIFHLPKDEQGPMIGKITRWLKPGGWLLFNLHVEEGDVVREDWMGATMFSSGLGVEGTREMLRKDGSDLRIVEDEIAVEKVGPFEEKFHWIFAKKVD